MTVMLYAVRRLGKDQWLTTFRPDYKAGDGRLQPQFGGQSGMKLLRSAAAAKGLATRAKKCEVVAFELVEVPSDEEE